MRKSLDDVRSASKANERLLDELAEFHAKQLLTGIAPANGRKLIARTFKDRDLTFVRLLAQKSTRLESNVVVFLASTSEQVSLVFAQSKGMPFDMGALLKETLAKLGGRGGGSKDLAQGGAPTSEGLEAVLEKLPQRLRA